MDGNSQATHPHVQDGRLDTAEGRGTAPALQDARAHTQGTQAQALIGQWRAQADDYMRLFKSARCGCSSADREVYLRVALTLKDCARQLEEWDN